MSSNIVISNDAPEAIRTFVEAILSAIDSLATDSKRSFITVGLSGGGLIKQLSDAVPAYLPQFAKHSDKLRFLFCDERFVPLDHADSTHFGYVSSNFYSLLNITDEHVYHIKADASSVEECAREYESRIKPLLNEDNGFDILLLGIGPDGHTCSLFPGHPLFLEAQNQTELVLPISDSPKPPPQRVTLTLPFINNSRFLFFLAVGEGKADIVKRILKDNDSTLPSANVKPRKTHASLVWYLDKGSASQL